MANNKVKYGLKNVHYAIYNSGTGTYGTPVAVPGAVNLSLSPEGESNTFYADNVAYYVTQADQGYSGDLEIAIIPDAMKKDVWGWTLNNDGVLVEDNQAAVATFALLFQVNGDQYNRHCVLYACTAGRPEITGATIGETAEPQTEAISLTAMPRSSDGIVQAVTTDTTTSTVISGWYSSVYTG